MNTWTCPKCGTENTEAPETVMAECSECGEAHDMVERNADETEQH